MSRADNLKSWRVSALIAIAIAGISVAAATSLILCAREAETRAAEGLKLAREIVTLHAALGDPQRTPEARRELVARVRTYLATQSTGRDRQDLARLYLSIADAEPNLRTALTDREAALALLSREGPMWSGRQIDIAQANLRIGETRAALGDTPGALTAFQSALELATRVGADHPSARRVIAAAHERLAARYRRTYDIRRASEHAQQAIAIYEGMPADPEARQSLMNSYVALAGILSRQNRPYEARELYTRVLDERMHRAAENPDSVQARIDLIQAHAGLAQVLGGTALSMGDDRGAAEHHRIALAIAERVAHENPGSVSAEAALGQQLSALGGALRTPAESAESQRLLKRALAIHRKLQAGDPGNANHEFFLTATLGDIGARLAKERNWTASAAALSEARDVIEKSITNDPANRTPKLLWLDVMHHLPPVMARLGDGAEAVRLARRAVEVAREQGALDSEVFRARIEIPLCLNTLAESYRALGKTEEASEAARKAADEWKQVRLAGRLPPGLEAEAMKVRDPGVNAQ